MAISNRYSSLARQTSSSPSFDSSSTPCKRAFGKSSKSLTAIQRSDQKLWPFRTVTQAWRVRPHHHQVSIPHQLHAKGHPENSSKSLIAIQRSDHKLWPFRTVTQACRDQTSSSPSIDSLSTPCKRASGKLQ